MSFCSACGMKSGDLDSFCSCCGQTLKNQSTKNKSPIENNRIAVIDIEKKVSIWLVPLITFEKIKLIVNGLDYEKVFKYGTHESISIPSGEIQLQATINTGLMNAKSNVICLDSKVTTNITIKLTFSMMGTPKLEVLYS